MNNTVLCTRFVNHVVCGNETFVADTHSVDLPGSPGFDVDIGVCFGLLFMIALCHGLNTAILSLDEDNCDILIRSGVEPDATLAKNVLPLVRRRVWFLISFLLVRVVCAESLPIFMNRMLSPMLSIIVASIVVVLFGDLVPALVFGSRRLVLASFFRYLCMCVMGATSIVAWPLSKVIGSVAGDGGAAFNWNRQNIKTLVSKQVGGGGDDEEDVLTHEEALCIQGALDLSQKTVFESMVPIQEVFMLEEGELITVALVETILAKGFSRVPIFRRERGHVIGFVLVRDLLTLFGKSVDKPVALGQLRVRRMIQVASQLSAFELLQRFKLGHAHIALVVARDLVTPIGVVCLSDVLELVVGAISDERDHDDQTGVGPPPLLAHGVSRRHGAGPAVEPPRLSQLVSQRIQSRRGPPPLRPAAHPAALSRAVPRGAAMSVNGDDETRPLIGGEHA
jgi:metal transporter CNNM